MTAAPPPPRARRLGPGLLLLASGGALVAGWSWQLARTCPVWIVNHTPQDVQVLRGETRLATIEVGRVLPLPLGEGTHTLRLVRRDGSEEVQLTLQRGFWERFADRAPFVLNVARAAALRWEEGVYAGGEDVPPPRPPRLFVGQSFFRVDDVDYCFTPLPDSLEGRSPGGERATCLMALGGSVLQALGAFPRETPLEVQLEFLARRLPIQPESDAIDYLLRLADEQDCAARADELLGPCLTRRPPQIDCHRAHQDLVRSRAEGEAALQEEYARLSAAEPDSAGLQYLAGRLEPDPARARARYERALELDPKLGWAWHGLAFLRAAAGELEPAHEAAQRARAALPDRPEVEALALQLMMLTGRAAEARAQLQATEQRRGLDGGQLRALLEACLAVGDHEGAQAACARYVAARTGSKDPWSRQRGLLGELALDELEGRWEELLSHVDELHRPGTQGRLRAAALLHLDRLEEVEALLAEGGPLAGATREALLLALAWSLRGDLARAARWRDAAAERLAAGPARERLAARALRAADPLSELPRVALPVPDQAALLLALAATRPAAREALLARAAPLVAGGELFPARYLRRAHAQLAAR